MDVEAEFVIYEQVAKVEERFRAVYDSEKVRDAKTEAQMEPEKVSTGWWVVLARFGVALRCGSKKPSIEAGDTLILTPTVRKKKPDAPALEVVPPEPPPIDAAAARTVFLESLSEEDRARVLQVLT